MKDMNSLTSIFDFLVLIHNNAGMNMEFFECLNNGNGISSLKERYWMRPIEGGI